MNNNSLTIKTIDINDKIFPNRLKLLKDCPKKIYVRGNIESKNNKIAIVGTRKATPEGLQTAKDFAKELSKNDIIIISGLAFGIDASAHQGALDENGRTWAVLAHGLDRIYPSSHESLAKKLLLQEGALISEYEQKTKTYPGNFIARNRIISALSDAVIVIEAPLKSGAISTASHAIKLGIPVFVVPGQISSPFYAGSHNIIRNGGRLVSSYKDILHDMNIEIKNKHNKEKNKKYSKQKQIIINAIISQNNISNIDKIAEITKLNTRDVTIELMELQIDGIIQNSYGQYFIKKQHQ